MRSRPRSRWLLTLALVLGAPPALAHGDMAAVSLFGAFALVMAAILGVIALGLAVGAVIFHRRSPASSGAIFGAGAMGVLAILVFVGAGTFAAMSFERTPDAFAFLLPLAPALLGAQLLVSARHYRRIDARGLATGSKVAAVIFFVVTALFLFAVLVSLFGDTSPPHGASDVPKYQRGCAQNNASDCNMLGLRLRTNNEIADAEAAFNKACTLGMAVGCSNLADTRAGKR